MVSVEATQVAAPRAMREVRGGGGLELHVREWGNVHGPPVVLVHGWSQSQLCWSRQIGGRLARDFRIVTFDLRGHGMSEKPLNAEQCQRLEVSWRVRASDVHLVAELAEKPHPGGEDLPVVGATLYQQTGRQRAKSPTRS